MSDGPSQKKRRGLEGRAALFLAALALLLATLSPAQDNAAETRFTETSLRLRTALHYDPLLDEALDALVKLYVGADRSDEIIALYRSHITQYPNDAGAKTVLLRLLRRLDRKGAEEAVAVVVAQHPDYAPLQYVLFRYLEERGDGRAVEALARAIDLESDAARRNAWLEELMRLSEGEAARAAAKLRLGKLVQAEGLATPTLLSLAKLAQRHRYWEEVVLALERARKQNPDPETLVEIDFILATALGQLNRGPQAATVLDALLARLAPEHWRRREILTLRFGILPGKEEREALLRTLETRWKAAPQSESAALDYADSLLGADRRAEAIAVLVAASTALPKSGLLESRALEHLEASPDPIPYVDYLTARLESSPERIDLRFRLVKAEYALRRDAAAEQDFKVVVAGLTPAEISDRILELQRYLRSIDRADAAVAYLERYVRENPARLDVASELVEIRVEGDQGNSIGELVRSLAPAKAEIENVLDFADYLMDRGFAAAARGVVEAKLATEPRHFELGLKLAEILGRVGDATLVRERLSATRDLAESPARYGQWLKAAVAAHRELDSLASFFDSEWSRYAVDDGAWPEEKVEKFLLLCEAGRRQIFAPRIAEGLRKQLAQPGVEAALRLRLRRVLVAVLEADPASAAEAEEQLRILETEDSNHRAEYQLRRALLNARSERIDLARGLLEETDFEAVTSASLLREAADILIEYGMLDEAESALGGLVRLEPEDFLSLERHLSVLAAQGDESSLRVALRRLLEEDGEVALRESSLRSLRRHLEASYWRSVAALIESESIGEVLPLLAAVEQEFASTGNLLWADWVRTRILARLGRGPEAREAMGRFLARAEAAGTGEVGFPDGLTLSVEAAESIADGLTSMPHPTASISAGFFATTPNLSWAFEVEDGARLVRMGRGEGRVLLLDDRDRVRCLDEASGKLLWVRDFGTASDPERRRRPEAFDAIARPARLGGGTLDPIMAKEARSFLCSGGRFFLVTGRACIAASVADGSLLWSTPLKEAPESRVSPGARPEVRIGVSGGRVVLFDPASGDLRAVEEGGGKLLWAITLGTGGEASPRSLHSGLCLSGAFGFAYGSESVVFNSANGAIVWRIRAGESADFPLVLRPPREGEEDVPRAQGLSVAPRRFDFAAESGAGSLAPDLFMAGASSLVGPAVHWAESRLEQGAPAFAEFGEGFLWLMLDGKVRRLSLDLPIHSRELPASGSYAGRSGQHLWFVQGGDLIHLDFRRQRSTRLVVGDPAAPPDLHATVVGQQVLVRAGSAFLLVNALTSEVIGRSAPPPSMVRYLEQVSARGASARSDEAGEAGPFVWQGRIHRPSPGRMPLCLGIQDLFAKDRAFCLVGRNVALCLEDPAAPRPKRPAPAAASPR